MTAATTGLAAPVPLDTTSASNGFTDLFSTTFDGSLVPCSGSSPSYCSFFGGEPPNANRAVVITPTPTGVINAVPLGFAAVPAAGSYLDLTLNGNQLTIAGGTIAVPSLVLQIKGGTPQATDVLANSAGVVFDIAPQVATLDANGRAEFFVNLSPATAVDFSNFTTVAFAPVGSCAGPLCSLISILTLDMVRYRLVIDYDPTLSYFTGTFIGQTANNSLLSITMNSVAPEIDVTDSVAPAGDRLVPFGDVTELTTATQTVTVTNTGTSNLLLGTVAGADSLAAPFALANDNCTGATIAPAASCTFNVTFSPGTAGSFGDTLDIVSNDADEPSVTVTLSGNGTALPVPNISVTDSVPPATDQSVPFGNIPVGATAGETVTVTNEGNADLVLGSIAALDGLAAPFTIISDSCSGQTLPQGGSCTLGVRFEPTAPGSFNDTFDIPSNDAADPTVTIAVSGGGTSLAAPDIVVTDNILPADDRLVPLGNITEGTSRDGTITVTNAGGLDLAIGTVGSSNALAAPFSVVTDNCSAQTLAPAGSCTVVVRFAPPTTGAASGSLNIPSNDPDEPSVIVQVSGTGITRGEGGVVSPSPGGGGGFMAIDPATLLLLGAAGAWGWRRRQSR